MCAVGAYANGVWQTPAVRRTRGEAEKLSPTGVPKSNEAFIPCASVARGDGWARQGDARRGAPSSGLFDLHSQHEYMWLGCRGLCWRTEEVGPRGHSTPKGTLSDKAFCYGRSVLTAVGSETGR